MTLYVWHCGPMPVGKPLSHRSNKSFGNAKQSPIEEFLKNISGDERVKRVIIGYIKHAQAIMWGGRAVGKETAIREGVKREIIPIIESGAIPENLDYSRLQTATGTAMREHLELNLFDLIKNIGEQELEGKTGA